jgi:hypothetical protein
VKREIADEENNSISDIRSRWNADAC